MDKRRIHTNNDGQSPPPRYRPPQPPPRFVPDFCRNGEMLSKPLLQNHLYHFIYIWLASGHEFWMFPVALDDDYTMSGYIWNGSGWTRHAFDTRLISALY